MTSGTAAMELGPAVVEAAYSRVPLVVLTADRPAELRDRGAPQTIDQDHLYGRMAKWFAELPLFDGDAATAAHVRSIAGRAVATAIAGPAGPVHLNVPFREPLLPDGPLGPSADEVATAAFVTVESGRRRLDDGAIAALAARIAGIERGLIVAGPDDDPATPRGCRGARRRHRLPDSRRPAVRPPDRRPRPEPGDRARGPAHAPGRPGSTRIGRRLVIRTGAMPTSKPIAELLARTEPELIVIDGDAGWRESALVPATFVHADPAADRARASPRGSPTTPRPGRATGWAAGWVDGGPDGGRGDGRRGWAALDEPFEGAPFPVLAAALPDGGDPVGRQLHARPRPGRLAARRPTGRSPCARTAAPTASTAWSRRPSARSAAGRRPGRARGRRRVVPPRPQRPRGREAARAVLRRSSLVNNDGGGIFSFLPQGTASIPGAGLPDRYEELFGTPHGIDVGPIVTALGGAYAVVGPADLGAQVERSIATPGVQVLELRTDRARNVALHREVAAVVAAAIRP